VRVGAAIAFTVFAVLGACTNKTPEPAALGNCVPAPDGAPCSAIVSGGGGGSGQGDGGGVDASVDASVEDSTTVLVDAATCGTAADSLFAAQFPSCSGCLATAAEAGAPTCCGQDSTCSMNTACTAILQCELACTTGVCACASVNTLGVTNFNAFAQCVTSICAAVCPPLTSVTIGDL
jgi:hypothetical protein